jgi:hypothetical protein
MSVLLPLNRHDFVGESGMPHPPLVVVTGYNSSFFNSFMAECLKHSLP